MADEKHLTAKGFILKFGPTATLVTLLFKRVGVSFSLPSKFQNVRDAGEGQGNFQETPEQDISMTFSVFATETQELHDLYLIIKDGVQEIEFTDGASGGTVLPHRFFGVVFDIDYSSEDDSVNISFTARAQGWSQGIESYGYTGP